MLDPHDAGADEHDLDLEADSSDEVAAEEPDPSDQAAAPPDLDPALEKELSNVLVDEEEAPKASQKQLPNRLIDQELRPEDLFDEGSI